VLFEFDPLKDQANQRKHGLPLDAGALILAGPFIEEEIDRSDLPEPRFKAIGPLPGLGDRLFVLVYCWRGNRRRFISVRKASEAEVRRYRRDHP
jgi:hypothetical protein